MDDMPKAAGVWLKQLLELNPWAQGFTIDKAFETARQSATRTRHLNGKELWNAWAKEMLALRSDLEGEGQWATKRRHFWEPQAGNNELTKVWLEFATAVFSSKESPYHIQSDISFNHYIFPGDARFENAIFSGDARFENATFLGDAIFLDTKFSRNAIFGDVTFCGVAWFRSASFAGIAIFGNATFSGDARFGSATFSGDAGFRGATFKNVPSFFGATFKDGTLRLDNVQTPRYGLLGFTPDKEATPRFRELRRRAAGAQDHDRELEFFAQEIRTGRFHARGLPPWMPKVWDWRFWLGLGFEALSNFGRSLWRPMLWWLALTAVCAAVFLGEHEEMRKARAAMAPSGTWSGLAAYAATTRSALANPPPCRVPDREPFASTDAVTEAIQLALKNALVVNVGSTDSTRRTFGCLYGLDDHQQAIVPARVAAVSTLQALASGLLIFLFLLAVRNLLRLR